ncbi:LamG-like jellyroll fold domain-containing protein, partial [Aestuariispira insulae]|uniref:LamG-like jellyroll fold domain-containing protein n=1 Tax=Aestuariispira insulae TaxID=1461337 RepID=UPI0011C03C14
GDYVIQDQGDGSYAITDAAGSTDTVTGVETLDFETGIDIDLTAANSGPQAVDAKVVLNSWDEVSHKLSASDADAGDSLSYEIVGAVSLSENVYTLTSGAEVTLNADGTYHYDPKGNTAADSFTWKVTDAAGLSSQATISVGVGGDPYTIDHSVSLNGSTDYLSWTPAAAGDRSQWAFSTWVKLDSLAPNQMLFSSKASDGHFYLWINDSGKLAVGFNTASGPSDVASSAVIDDTQGWHHVVLSVDTTQANEADRLRLYLDGERADWAGTSTFAQNAQYGIGAASEHRIGRHYESYDYHMDGSFAETVLIDGQALGADSFGVPDGSGDWSARDISSLSAGSNGFHLDYNEAAALGGDVSGNGHDFTVNGTPVQGADVPPVSAMSADYTGTDGNDVLIGDDQTVTIDGGAGDDLIQAGDVTPDELVAVSEGAAFSTANSHSGFSFSEDGQTVSMGTSFAGSAIADIEMSSGQFYWEVKFTDVAYENGHYWHEGTVGIANQAFGINDKAPQGNAWVIRGESGAVVDDYKADAYMDGVWHPEFGSEIGENDVLGVAFDATAGTIEFFLNGESMKKFSGIPEGSYNPIVSRHNTAASRPATFEFNFGQDGFAHEVPSGFHSVYAVPGSDAGATLLGGLGDDTLIGGTGSDVIDGGEGTDVLKLAGSYADYVIQDQGDGSFAITDAAGSTDSVTGVETLDFETGNDIDLTAANNGPQAVDAKV